jgi:hypothetical protein
MRRERGRLWREREREREREFSGSEAREGYLRYTSKPSSAVRTCGLKDSDSRLTSLGTVSGARNITNLGSRGLEEGWIRRIVQRVGGVDLTVSEYEKAYVWTDCQCVPIRLHVSVCA